MKGYKVFKPDWTCRGKQYTCPGMFEEEGKGNVGKLGMHFCLKLADCFNYYRFDPKNHVAEVIAYGNIEIKGDKCCTDKLEIVRELTWQEVLEMVNTGKNCTGFGNAGNGNTGDRSSGDRNTGHRNTGNCNAGNCNTGHKNTGHWNMGGYNTGDYNVGKWNTGNNNTGDGNTGDFNAANYSSGCFNTVEQKIMLFNKLSDWTYRAWLSSDARNLLRHMPNCVVEWVDSDDMSEDEKEAHPTYETTGGYLKECSGSESAKIRQAWWDGLGEKDKQLIKSLPNFDPDIFKQCTGIKVKTR